MLMLRQEEVWFNQAKVPGWEGGERVLEADGTGFPTGSTWNQGPFPTWRGLAFHIGGPQQPHSVECGNQGPQPPLEQSGESLRRGWRGISNNKLFWLLMGPMTHLLPNREYVQGCPFNVTLTHDLI